MIRQTLIWAAAGLTAAVVGCSSSKSSSSGGGGVAKTGTVVAHIGDDTITSDEIKSRMAEQAPYMRQRLADPTARKEFLENMIKIDVMAQEALKKGLDKSPDVQAQFKRLLVQGLVKEENQAKIDVSDSDLKAYFDKHVADYVKPEKVRVQQIFVAVADPKAKAKATGLLNQIKAELAKDAQNKTPAAAAAPLPKFIELARENSDDTQTKPFGGDTRFLSEEEFTQKDSAEFAKAVFAMTPDNALQLVETPKGYHVVRFMARQAASAQSLDDPNFKRQLTDRYLAEARSKHLEDYYQELRKAANVSIDEGALAAVEVPAGGGMAHASPFGLPGGIPRPMPPPGAQGIPHIMPPPGAPGTAPHPVAPRQ